MASAAEDQRMNKRFDEEIAEKVAEKQGQNGL